jgi:aryl-alcohol dehydrogenase-like predicted oxidoreductase
MKYRTLGKTGYKISEIGYGSWSLGADWGDVSEEQAFDTLKAVLDSHINFIDTADVYGDGRSEKLIAAFKKKTKKDFYIVTKLGRRLKPFTAEGFTKKNIFSFVERSLKNLNTHCLDLIQLHCPPTQVYYMPEVFKILDELVQQKMIRHYGVSVEKVEEALKAIEYSDVATVQIIFNMFRQRPMELFFKEATKKNIGIIVRVPLASGLLTGKMDAKTEFAKNDHRQFNRHGEAFDVGETFAGVDFEKGLSAVEKLKAIKPSQYAMSQFAIKWILMQKAVSTVIAGGKSSLQVQENVKATALPSLSPKIMKKIETVYDNDIKQQVHQRW